MVSGQEPCASPNHTVDLTSIKFVPRLDLKLIFHSSQVSCRAEKLEDGRYSITGTKIFITCGEHDITSNIVHLVLARIPGGPPGTHGISLFAVPKHLIENGEVSADFNGVNIGRIEVSRKMNHPL